MIAHDDPDQDHHNGPSGSLLHRVAIFKFRNRSDTVECPAGSIAVFTSYNFHASGPNTTDALRRVYLAQYSCEPIRRGEELWGNAEALLVDGEYVTTGLTPPALESPS